ncbi:MAG: translation initiation factor IF-3 [Rickettsiales bacterium]|nr:translation initiation factor IF-3 [Rickettsiales bacterium]
MSYKNTRDSGPRLNRDIRASEIRLVDHEGNMVGVVSVDEGVTMAEKVGLDLVEVSPNATPPVCKILDYGKYKYEQQKKAHEAKKKQKVVNIKEVKLRPNIDTHDLGIKMKAVHKFLDAGDKVKFTLRFRGREMAHQEIGMQLLTKIQDELGEKIKVEHRPSFEGRQVVMVVSPAKAT